MLKNPDHITARSLLLDRVSALGTETVPLLDCGGRVLARPLVAAENIPAFDRSPLDGYAFRAADTAGAALGAPVTLRVLESIPAGAVPTQTVTAGTATRLMTGAPIPAGADAVVKYEDTRFTDTQVTLFAPAAPGANIVRAGEDVRQGTVLAQCGRIIDPGLAGTLAAQGVAAPTVYRVPRVGILSTGSELVEADAPAGPGMIRNSNAYTLSAALRRVGMEPVYLGMAGDSEAAIAALLEQGLQSCDAVISTGGVSVGDFDLTPAAMERVGAELLFRGAKIKPGMACAYGIRDGKPVCGLSGNPASFLTNFYVIAQPALRALAGWQDPVPKLFPVALCTGFPKASPGTRFLRGTLELIDGRARMRMSADQGNVVLSSAIGCDMMAVVPGGAGPLAADTIVKGFLI